MARFALTPHAGIMRALAVLGVSLLPSFAFSIVPITRLIQDAAGDGLGAIEFGRRSAETLWNTVLLAAGAAAGAAVLGVPTGLALGVAQWRGRALLRAILLIPLALPPYFHGIGWLQILRANGAVARSIAAMTNGSPATPISWLQTLPGAIAVLALAYFPLVALFAEKALSLAPRSLPEAAAVFGARRSAMFRHVYWPCIRPAVLSAALIIAILAASDLGVSTLTRVDVFSFRVLTQLAAFNNIAEATLLMLPLLVLGLVALALAPAFTADPVATEPADAFLPLPVGARGGRRRVAWVTALAAAAALAPLLAIMSNATRADAWRAMIPVATSTLGNTLFYVAGATVISIGLALALGVAVRGRGAYIARAVQTALVIGFATPGAVLGLALIGSYASPPLSDWIGPHGLVIAALLVRFQIVSYIALSASAAQIPAAVLESASIDGAGLMRRMTGVELPLLRTPLLVAAASLAVLSFAEIAAVILLYPPGGETMMVALYTIEANSPVSYVAVMSALCAVLILGLLGIAAAIALAIRPRTATAERR